MQQGIFKGLLKLFSANEQITKGAHERSRSLCAEG